MLQQVTVLCLSAVLNTAYERSPALEAYRKNNILHSRYSNPKQYLPQHSNEHGLLVLSREAQVHDSTRNYEQFGMYNHMQPIRYPRESGVHIHGRGSRRMLRNGKTRHTGRGLFMGWRNSLTRSFKDAVGKSARATKDLLQGSVKFATDVVMDSTKLGKDIIESTVNVTKKAIDWMTAKTIRIGKLMVEAPLQGIELTVNAAWAAHTFGTGLTAQIVSDTAEWFQGNWNAVKAMEFPGKNLVVLLYPSGLMSVVNKITKEIMYMTDRGHEMLTHGLAYTLYLSLKIVFGSVNAVMKLSNLNCVKLIPQKIRLNEKMIGTISTKSGKACGISHLKPTSSVTITRNDKKFLIATTPWVLDDLSVNMTGVTVNGIGRIGTILDNEMMDTKIKRIKATGTVSFEAGTLLRFVNINIEIDEIEGLNVNFPTNQKNIWMKTIEGLSSRMSSLVTQQINHILQKIKKKVFNYIAQI